MLALWLFFLLVVPADARDIRVAVSANLAYVITPLIQSFERTHSDIHVVPILGSTGKLTTQIMHGAPYALLLSADMDYAKKLYQAGFSSQAPKVYAKGALVYLSAKPRDFSKIYTLLSASSIRKIAVANPKTAPYGVAAKEALEKAGIYQKVFSKFVYGESISQTLSYALKAADIGLVAKSSIYAPSLKGHIYYADVNASLYRPISQGMVLLNKSPSLKDAQLFYDYLQSQDAKRIFRFYGYQVDE